MAEEGERSGIVDKQYWSYRTNEVSNTIDRENGIHYTTLLSTFTLNISI